MPDKVRWALLSTANINKALIAPLQRAQRSELVGVASRNADQAAAYAAKWGIPRSYGSYDEMLADPGIDAIYNPLPNSLHAEWTIKAAQAGKSVLCEKPLVTSLAELDQVEQAAQQNGVTVFEAFMYLHHPQTLKIKELIESGRIGTLQTIHSWFHFYLPPSDADNVRLQSGLAGGAAWDVGVYPNSISIVMSGGKAPAQVWAQQLTGESGVDVAMRAQMRFANDVTAQVSSGFRTPFREGAWFVGSEGIIEAPHPWKPHELGTASRITITNRDDNVETLDFALEDPYDCEVAAMEACVLDGAAPLVPLSLSRAFLHTMLAVYESAATGAVVTL